MLAPATGALALSGQTPFASYPITVAVPRGALTLTGTTPTVTNAPPPDVFSHIRLVLDGPPTAGAVDDVAFASGTVALETFAVGYIDDVTFTSTEE